MSETTMLPIRSIERDPAVQVRRKVDQPTVERYIEDWPLLPPITVFRLPDGRLLLVDGWHRLAAAERIPLAQVAAVIREGNYTAACDEAARANMASGRQLSKEERHEAIVRTYERHKPTTQQEVADLLGISQMTVSRVLTIEDIKDGVGPLNNIITPASQKPSGGVGRPKQSIKDDHYVALAAAPEEDRKPLAEATIERGWTPRETREAVREVKDPATPPERKEELRQGKVDPMLSTPQGEPAALPETFARAMAEPVGNPLYERYKHAAGVLAELATIDDVGEAVVAGLGAADLAALANDPLRIPRYVSVLHDIREAAQRALRPSLQEVR